jgi:hypothetical protein
MKHKTQKLTSACLAFPAASTRAMTADVASSRAFSVGLSATRSLFVLEGVMGEE